MVRISIFMAACLGVAGCATTSQGDVVRSGLTALEGQPLSRAMGTLGIPSSQFQLGADTVYVWRKDNVRLPMVSGVLSCEVRARAGANGMIVQTDIDGNTGACEQFASSFK